MEKEVTAEGSNFIGTLFKGRMLQRKFSNGIVSSQSVYNLFQAYINFA